uniref:Uncharacterized protein n=1 Tax=Crocodylus porosus TaxID=8502 RepID=A0A7M4FV42_CROPO
MLTSYATLERSLSNFLEGQVAFSHLRLSNNRSVMPLGVQGCMRTTLTGSGCVYPMLTGASNPLNPIFPNHKNSSWSSSSLWLERSNSQNST